MIAQPKIDKLILLYAVCGTIASAALPDFPTELDRKIAATIATTADEQDLSWLTPQLRPQVIARLREAVQDKDSRGWGLAGLLVLGDAETINALMNKWRTAPDFGPERSDALDKLVKYTPTAVLLPLLAPYLDDTRIYRYGGGDTPGDTEWRLKAATEMNDVIYLRKEFPEATQAWAHTLGRDLEKYTKIKPWWEHNKDLITAGRYAEATWLPPSTDERPPRPTKARPPASSATDSADAMSDPSKQSQAPSTTRQTGSFSWPLGITLLAAALSLCWVVIKNRKSK